MSQIILDFGSANTCQNDTKYIKRMYDELKAVDTGKHEVIVKWQLFEKAGENKPLLPECFEFAYDYGTKLGYKVTSSVFDKNSLDFLLRFDIPFVKIANNRKLDWLIGEVPRRVPIIMSVGPHAPDCQYITQDFPGFRLINDWLLHCVSNYPALYQDYTDNFNPYQLKWGISDHTTDFSLFRKFEPEVIEWHYVLEHDPKNLDGGLFARTPAMLAEVL